MPLDDSNSLMTYLEGEGGKRKNQTKESLLAEDVHRFRKDGGDPTEELPRPTGDTCGEQTDLRRAPTPHDPLEDF